MPDPTLFDPTRPAIVYRVEEDDIALADQARDALKSAIRNEAKSREDYLAFGRLLNRIQEMRQQAREGHTWEEWLKENIPCSIRTARHWMHQARIKDQPAPIPATVAGTHPGKSQIQDGAARADARHEQNG